MKFKNSGFSLLETMLACAIGLILTASIYQVYLIIKKNYFIETNLSELQENMRYASNILTRNIRAAGFSGCRKIDDLIAEKHFTEHNSNFNFSLENSIRGFNSKNAPAYLSGKISENTDCIVIQKSDADITNLITNIKPPATTFYVYQNPATQDNKMLFLTDCDYADLFQAKNAGGSIISLDKGKIEHDYNLLDSKLGRFTEIAYFISNTSRKDSFGAPIYALFETINRGNREELVSGINNMQIRYGINHSDEKVSFYSATEIDQLKLWSQVKCVQIDLDFVYQNHQTKKISFDIALRER